MIKRYLIIFTICLFSVNFHLPLLSAQTTSNNNVSTDKIKTAVQTRGTGKKKRVEVKLMNGNNLKGYITRIDENSFTLADSKTNQNTVIAYSEVEKIENRLSKGDKVALWIVGGAAAVGGIILGSFILTRCRNEGGC